MPSTTIDTDRFVRQAELVPQERLAEMGATVIGVGAIGRQVALQLAAIGVRRLQLVDFDQVDLTNLTTQGYEAGDVGQAKVLATAAAIQRIDPAINVESIQDRFRPKLATGEALFAASIRSTRGPPFGARSSTAAGSGPTGGCWVK